MIYFDNAATTKPSLQAISAMNEMMLENYYNPASLHDGGIKAEKEVEKARETLAEIMGVESKCLYFTSGGTASNNIAIRGFLQGKKKGRIICSAFEHPSVMECFKSLEPQFEVVYIKPENGVITKNIVEKSLSDDTLFVSIMHINNETGAINEMKKISELLKSKDITFHCDAVQGFLKLPFKYSAADMVSFSGHKTRAPKGIGAVYIKEGIKTKPIIFGGGQEKNIHSGTLNSIGVVAWAAAAKDLFKNFDINNKKVHSINEFIKKQIVSMGGIIVSPEMSSDYIISIAFADYIAENILHYLSLKNIYVSTGSACSSKKASHVMKVLGLERYSKNILRISLSNDNTEEEAKIFINTLKDALKEIIKV